MKFNRAGLAYLHDLLMTGLAFVAAFYLRVGDHLFGFYFEGLLEGLVVVLLTAAITYRLLGLYRGIWRYASAPDLILVTKAATVVSVVSVLLLFLLTRLDTIPRSIPVIQWFVLLFLLGGPRFGYRLFKDRRLALADFSGGEHRVPVLLVGAEDGSDQLIRALSHTPQAAYRVVGVVDDKGGRIGREIRGVPVLGGVEDLPTVVEALHRRGVKAQRLIVTKPEADHDGDLIRRLLDLAEPLGLSLSRLPSLTEFKDALGEGKIELRPIAVEDLLGRPQTVLDRSAIEGLIAGRRVLVTGAGGTIGSELTRQIAALGPAELTMVDAGEFNLYTIDGEIRGRYPGLACHSVIADVRERARVLRLFQDARPDLVFHAAALKQYQTCRSVLERELGVRPEHETEALLREIRERRRTSRAEPAGTVPPALETAGASPRLFPRAPELLVAAILCAERPGRIVWIASWLGIVGVAISLWPQLRTAFDDDLGLTEAGMGAMLVCGAALFSAGSQTAVRRLTATNTPATIVLVFSVFSIVALCAPAAWGWVPPKPGDWPVLAAVGMLAAAAQWCTARSYARIGAARAAPVDLMQIPVSAVVGWVLFAEVPTGWGVSGALTIMAASIWVTSARGK